MCVGFLYVCAGAGGNAHNNCLRRNIRRSGSLLACFARAQLLPKVHISHFGNRRMVVEFREWTQMLLGDMPGHLHQCIALLSRSALCRCLVRHGICQLPKSTCVPKHAEFASTVRIGSSELWLERGKKHVLVSNDRVTKLTYVALFDAATKCNGAMALASEEMALRIIEVILLRVLAAD